MTDINSVFVVQTVPTICGPVSDFKKLTTNANAYSLGWMGFGAGVLASVIFVLTFYVVGPRVYYYGIDKGWW
jgi:hypothetical protein